VRQNASRVAAGWNLGADSENPKRESRMEAKAFRYAGIAGPAAASRSDQKRHEQAVTKAGRH